MTDSHDHDKPSTALDEILSFNIESLYKIETNITPLLPPNGYKSVEEEKEGEQQDMHSNQSDIRWFINLQEDKKNSKKDKVIEKPASPLTKIFSFSQKYVGIFGGIPGRILSISFAAIGLLVGLVLAPIFGWFANGQTNTDKLKRFIKASANIFAFIGYYGFEVPLKAIFTFIGLCLITPPAEIRMGIVYLLIWFSTTSKERAQIRSGQKTLVSGYKDNVLQQAWENNVQPALNIANEKEIQAIKLQLQICALLLKNTPNTNQIKTLQKQILSLMKSYIDTEIGSNVSDILYKQLGDNKFDIEQLGISEEKSFNKDFIKDLLVLKVNDGDKIQEFQQKLLKREKELMSQISENTEQTSSDITPKPN